jgi:DNA-binding response OmpR family regulator
MNSRILIVEDDDFSRGAMEKILQSYGYETSSCWDGEEAISRLEEDGFDILITDLHMPGMDGFELIRKVRMNHTDLSTILITGCPTEEVRCKVKEERVDGFFPKPVDWDELQLLLDTLSGSEKVGNKNRTPSLTAGKMPRPRGLTLALMLFLLIVFDVQPSKGQPPFHFKNRPILRMDSQEACWQSPDLDLKEGQKKALEALQHGYMAEAMPLRREILLLRFELRYLIRDPNITPRVLLDRQKRILEFLMKLDSLSSSYQMKVRSIFTKEQLERLPDDCLPGIGGGYEMFMGIGRRPGGGTH